MPFFFVLFIATLFSFVTIAAEQAVPRIDTFQAPNGKWSIDHHSKDNGWEDSFLALRLSDAPAMKYFATIEAAIQGAPIWSPDSTLAVFNTGYSTHLHPYIFQISESGTVKEVEPFLTFFSKAQRSGKIPRSEEQEYETGHHYLLCHYYDEATKAFWFSYRGDYALKRQGKPQHVQRNFAVSLDPSSLNFRFHDNLPRPPEPVQPARPASSGLSATGTGFVIDNSGNILTCNHLVDGASFIKVHSESTSYDAFVAFADKEFDVAVLQVVKLPSIEPLPLGLTTSVDLADDVFTIGFPNTTIQGFSPKYTRGEISALTGPGDDPHLLQMSTPVQPGNSGGALVGSDGVVVGIVAAKLDAVRAARVTGDIAQNVNYSLKITKLSRLIKDWNLTLPPAKPMKTRREAVNRARKASLRISVYGRSASSE